MFKYFLGNSPSWFKITMIFFLIINIPIYFINPTVSSWLFIAEFIFTLAMALKCYPLQSGGLLAIQVLLLGLTTPHNAYHEVDQNLEVVLLLSKKLAKNLLELLHKMLKKYCLVPLNLENCLYMVKMMEKNI